MDCLYRSRSICLFLVFLFLAFFYYPLLVYAQEVPNGEDRLANYLSGQRHASLEEILNNIIGARHILFDSAEDPRGFPTAVIAAPSLVYDDIRGEWQNYYYNWIRDQSLVMQTVFRLLRQGELKDISKDRKIQFAKAYLQFSTKAQYLHLNARGEFELGHALVTPLVERNPREWGGPQNDGPPLRILTFYEVAKMFRDLSVTDVKLLTELIQVVARDAQYVIENYHQPAVERWEEEKAESHFSILLESLEGLRAALKIVNLLPPVVTAQAFINVNRVEAVIKDIGEKIDSDYVRGQPFIYASKKMIPVGSLVRNKEGFDMQVIMTAVERYSLDDQAEHLTDRYPPHHPLMRSTFHLLRRFFQERYPVNSHGIDPTTGEALRGVLFGRYREDTHFGGRPWFITTFAAIQFLLWDARYLLKHPLVISEIDLPYFQALDSGLRKEDLTPGQYSIDSDVSQSIRYGLVKFAHDILFRVMVHTGSNDYTLTEVLDAYTGYKGGIFNLTWSYTAAHEMLDMIKGAIRDGLAMEGFRLPSPPPPKSIVQEPSLVFFRQDQESNLQNKMDKNNIGIDGSFASCAWTLFGPSFEVDQ